MRHLLVATKAFADPTRVRLICVLRGEELCVCELCDVLGVVQSTLSTHLQYLRQARLVRTRNEGKWVYYTLSGDFTRVADALFKLHRAELESDAQIRKDAAGLKKRLALRKEGSCCLGFTTIRPAARRRGATGDS